MHLDRCPRGCHLSKRTVCLDDAIARQKELVTGAAPWFLIVSRTLVCSFIKTFMFLPQSILLVLSIIVARKESRGRSYHSYCKRYIYALSSFLVVYLDISPVCLRCCLSHPESFCLSLLLDSAWLATVQAEATAQLLVSFPLHETGLVSVALWYDDTLKLCYFVVQAGWLQSEFHSYRGISLQARRRR